MGIAGALLFLRLLVPPVSGGLGESYVRAVAAWGHVPVAVKAVRWCDEPGAMACWELQEGSFWGYFDDKSAVITISDQVPERMLQTTMSHEVGHGLGLAHTATGMMCGWLTQIGRELPNPLDRSLLDRR